VPDDPHLEVDHYLRYVISEGSGDLRDRLHGALVERALKTDQPGDLFTVKAVRERVARLASADDYPRELIVQTLNGLIATGAAEEAPDPSAAGEPLYRLAPSRFTHLSQVIATSRSEEEQVRKTLLRRIATRHGDVTEGEAARIVEAFHTFVGRMLSRFGETCAQRLFEASDLASVDELPAFRLELDEALASLTEQLKAPAAAAFEDVLRDPDEGERAYLFSAGQLFYVTRLLGLDPELQTLQRVRFEDTTLYLDTNVLLPTLLTSHNDHAAVAALLNMCRSLGFRMHFAERTGEELDALIESAQQEYVSAPPFNLKTAATFAPLVENPILAAFFDSWTSHQLGWNQFLVPIKAWRGQLENKLDIRLDPGLTERDTERYDLLKRAIMGSATMRNGHKWYERPERSADHDAQVVSAIEHTVAEDNATDHPFGNRFWFITRDRHVASKVARRLIPDVGTVCMLVEEWAQYISPFVGPTISQKERADVFAKLLSGRFASTMTETLRLEEIQPFTTPGVAKLIEGVSREEACRAIVELRTAGMLAGGPKAKPPDELLTRLNTLVERRARQKLRSGDLVSADDVHRRETEWREQAARQQVASDERGAYIDELEGQLRRYKRTSLTFARDAIARKSRIAVQRARAYIQSDTRSFVLGLAAIAGGLVLLRFDLLGVVGDILQYGAFVIALLAWLRLNARYKRGR
jgi:hypothetical protein